MKIYENWENNKNIIWTNIDLVSVVFTWEYFTFTTSGQATGAYNEFENYTFEVTATSPRSQWVKINSLYLPLSCWMQN